jgi:hypothetical protein
MKSNRVEFVNISMGYAGIRAERRFEAIRLASGYERSLNILRMSDHGIAII